MQMKISIEYQWDDTDRGNPKYLDENLCRFHAVKKKKKKSHALIWDRNRAFVVTDR
jgi:hypothetical protein